MSKVSFDLHFSTDNPDSSGCAFSPEAIKDICAQIKDKPIQVATQEHTFPIGAIREGELIGNTVKCQGEIFYLAPTVIERDGKVEIMSIDLMSTPFALNHKQQKKTCEWTQTEILENDLGSVWKCSACKTVEVHAGRTMPYKYCPYCAAEITKFNKLKSAKESLDDRDPRALEAAILWLMEVFPGSFINSSCEVILDRETNTYFNLKSVSSLTTLRCKVIEWVSRTSCKTEPYNNSTQKGRDKNAEHQSRIRRSLNQFLGTKFSQDEWLYIYTYLGNECNRPLCEKFVDSGYDLEVIRKAKGNR